MHARQLTTIALLSAVGTALFVAESFIPMPFPFLKIGLANVSSVVALVLLGPRPMLIVVMIRIVAGSLLVGTLFSPGFTLAFSAGLASATAMVLTKKLTGKLFSVVGISLIGSVTHVVTQLLVVLALYVKNSAVLYILPLLLLSAIIGGLIVGWVSARMLVLLRNIRIE